MASKTAKKTDPASVKQFENLKTLLKSQKNAKGKDLYAHVQALFQKLVLHYPD